MQQSWHAAIRCVHPHHSMRTMAVPTLALATVAADSAPGTQPRITGGILWHQLSSYPHDHPGSYPTSRFSSRSPGMHASEWHAHGTRWRSLLRPQGQQTQQRAQALAPAPGSCAGSWPLTTGTGNPALAARYSTTSVGSSIAFPNGTRVTMIL